MTNSKDRYRGARRLAGALVSTALVGTGAIAATGIAYAEESPIEGVLETFDAADLVAEAAELPAGLKDAIQRDLGISAEDYLANAYAAKSASDVAASLEAGGVGIEGVVIDGQDVTLYVSAEADVEAAAAVGAKVEVGEPPSEDYSDLEWEAKADHKGGYGYAFEADGGIFRCSVGFSGYSPEGTDRFLTAGHCGVDGETYEEVDAPIHHIELDEPIFDTDDWANDFPGPELGAITAGSMTFGPGVHNDGGLIDVTGDFTGLPQVAGWGGGSGAPDAESVTIHDSIEAVVGAQACKSGATSGWTCGEITEAESTVEFGTGETVTGVIFSACMLGGDSGGSIVVGNFALGVNSGSTWESCDDDPNDNFGIGYAVAGGEYNASALFGDEWELNVAVNTPAINTAGATEDGTTLNGAVDQAGANHRVTVTVDGVGDFEADLDADGKFAIDAGALEVGTEYTYSAQAFYGNFSQSEVATGSFTVEEAVQVADLVVSSPSDDQTTSNPRPPFEGTGEPGADITLLVGENELGAATVGDGGNWTLEPESDLPTGVRFDATVRQTAGEDVQDVTVAGLGVSLPEITVTAPEDGSEVAGDVTFTGTSFPGASIGLQIEGTVSEADDAAPSFGAASDEFAPAEEDEDMDTWEGDFEIDDEGNWTFTPAEPLADGEYTLTAQAMLEDGDPELSSSETTADFTVVTEDTGDEGDDELPDTGSSSLPIILIGVGLLAAGGAAFAIRRRNANVA